MCVAQLRVCPLFDKKLAPIPPLYAQRHFLKHSATHTICDMQKPIAPRVCEPKIQIWEKYAMIFDRVAERMGEASERDMWIEAKVR